MGILKSVYEESDKIGQSVDNLVSLEKTLSGGIGSLE